MRLVAPPARGLRRRSARGPAGAALALALAAGVAACSSTAPAGAYGPGVMGGGSGPGMMGGGYGQGAGGGGTGEATAGMVAPADAARLGSAAPTGATVDAADNTATFSAGPVRLVVLGAPPDGPDETFRFAGLVNPSIVVPAGAKVSVELINADAGMEHDFLVTSATPPFSAMIMMSGPVAAGAATDTLPAATGSAMPETATTFTAPAPGRYTYLCTVPGHAAEGMYGAFVTVGG